MKKGMKLTLQEGYRKFAKMLEKKKFVEFRVLETVTLAVGMDLTQREIAKIFGVSQNTIYHDMHVKLPRISKDLSEQVQMVMKRHKDESLIGGERCPIKPKNVHKS